MCLRSGRTTVAQLAEALSTLSPDALVFVSGEHSDGYLSVCWDDGREVDVLGP